MAVKKLSVELRLKNNIVKISYFKCVKKYEKQKRRGLRRHQLSITIPSNKTFFFEIAIYVTQYGFSEVQNSQTGMDFMFHSCRILMKVKFSKLTDCRTKIVLI